MKYIRAIGFLRKNTWVPVTLCPPSEVNPDSGIQEKYSGSAVLHPSATSYGDVPSGIYVSVVYKISTNSDSCGTLRLGKRFTYVHYSKFSNLLCHSGAV